MTSDKVQNDYSECPQCEANSVSFHDETETFEYGAGDDSVELRARVPVGHCAKCEFIFTDARAEQKRHEAVCKYLGRLTPSEVRGIREAFAISQEQFGSVTGIGEASIRRWETGNRIQTEANDKYLRIIRRAGSLQALADVFDDDQQGDSLPSRLPDDDFRFRAIEVTPHVQASANDFELRPVAA